MKSLFGLPTDLDSEELPYAEKLNELHELIEKLEQRFSDDEYLSSSSGESTLHQVGSISVLSFDFVVDH